MKFGGDTSKLQEALKKVNSSTSSLSKELRGINSLLKLDPKNTELVAQKQQVLSENIKETSRKLNELKGVQDQVYQKWQNYIKQEDKIKNITAAIENTKKELEDLQKAQKKAQEQFEKGEITEEQYNQIANKVKECKVQLSDLKKEQKELNETTVSTEQYRDYQREVEKAKIELNSLQKAQKELNLETSKWTNVSEKLSSASKGLNKISTITSDISSKINKSITIPMIALGTATATTSISFLKLKEDTKTAFKVLLGSTEAAQKMLEDLHKFAKTTPFSYATYLETGKSLVSMGIAAENVIPYLEGITNAAIATGNGEEAITSISSALGKMTTQTKLSLEYMYQISDQGIPVFRILGNQLGVSTSKLMEMISAGKLASSEMIPKLIKGINEGTDGINGATSAFAGLATETKSNLSGALDSLKSKFRNMSMEIWNAEEAYPELNKIIREFTKSLDVLPKVFQSLSKAAVPILQNITKAFNTLNEKLSKMDDEQLRKFGNAILGLAVAGPVLGIISKFTGGLSALFSVGSKLTGTIAQLINGTGAFAKVLPLLTGPAGIIVGITATAIALLTVLYNKSETFRNSINKAFKTIKDTLSDMWQKIKPQLEELGTALGTLLEKIKPIAEFLVKVLGVAFEILAKVISVVIEKIVKKISFMINIVTLIINAWNGIILFFTETIPNAFQTFIKSISDLFKKGCNFIINSWNSIFAFFSKTVPNAIKNAIQMFINSISYLSEKIWNLLVNGWNSIVTFFTNTIPQWVQNVINWFRELPYKIGYHMGESYGSIIKFGLDIWNWTTIELPKIIQNIISWFAQLPREDLDMAI